MDIRGGWEWGLERAGKKGVGVIGEEWWDEHGGCVGAWGNCWSGCLMLRGGKIW